MKKSIKNCRKEREIVESICFHHYCCNTIDTFPQLVMFSWIKEVSHGGFWPNYHLIFYRPCGKSIILKYRVGQSKLPSKLTDEQPWQDIFCYHQHYNLFVWFPFSQSWIVNHGDFNAQTFPPLNISNHKST